MAICPSCDYPIPDDRERVGARCPNCRDPLYEPPGRFGRPVREGEGACSVHPECESVGPCGRCGNFMCETCRTRWREQILCAACVDRALESREAAPEQSRTHFRQALMALVLGVGAWVLGVVGFVVVVLAVIAAGGQQTPATTVIAGLIIIVMFLAGSATAMFGIGQAVAVLRVRGSHMILATIGLTVGGLFIGMFIGFFALSIFLGT
jgi:hypothetical protein